MTIEADIATALTSLVAGRVFPDFAPIATVKPYITYTQVGGEAVNYLDNVIPDGKFGRFQVNVWHNKRPEAAALMLQVEAAMILSTTFQARPVSAPISSYDHDMLTYGSMQDFNVFSVR